MKKKTLKKLIAFVIIALAAVGIIMFLPSIFELLIFMGVVLLPFALAYVVSFFANNMADGLQKRFKLPRNISAIIVIILIVGVIGGFLTGIIWKIIDEIKDFYDNFPIVYRKIEISWSNASQRFSDIVKTMPYNVQVFFNNLYAQVMEWLTNLVKDTRFLRTAGNFAKKLPSILISIITFILSLYFMISDSEIIETQLKSHISPKFQDRVAQLKAEFKKYLGGYVKAELIIMCISFAIILAGLLIIKIDYALIIALAIAIFDALPFFGSGAVLIPWSIIGFLSGNAMCGIGMIIIYLSVLLTRQLVEPKIVGKNIGLHPLLTLFSMYAGYHIFSIGGLILGPIVMMLIVSFYKIGIFDGISKFFNVVFCKVKKEYNDFLNSLYDEGE